ncbi:MAG: acyltransferase family protein, partial [Sphingomonas sp.]|nr:acyltransferase family protein [Sphingomonas sp.]
MDWLRVGAFGLLIFYHIGMVFVPWDFHAKAPVTIDWVKLPMQAVNAWRLALLFVVSGYASRAIFARAPAVPRFLWGRTKRLIPPLLFGVAVVVPLQPWFELVGKQGYQGSFWHFYTHDFWSASVVRGIILPTWNHLWFVGYLWVYTLLLAIALAVVPARARAGLARAVDAALAGPLILIVPIALLAANWAWSFPGVAETHALVDDWGAHR